MSKRTRSKRFVPWWRKNYILSSFYAVLVFPVFLLAKVLPKTHFSVYGSFNGFLVGDNTLYAFRQDVHGRAFFITHNKGALEHCDSNFVHMFSLRGIWLQLRAENAYYSHSIDDFFGPAIMGSNVVAVGHGIPNKRNASADARNKWLQGKFLRSVILWIVPFLYYYYCDQVESPHKFFDLKKLEVYGYTKPTIIRNELPRLKGLEIQTSAERNKNLVFAPTYQMHRSLRNLLELYGFYTQDFEDFMRNTGRKIYIKPHYQDEGNLDRVPLPRFCEWHKSTNDNDNLRHFSALITDFSSIFYDAHRMGLGVVFMNTDIDNYNQNEVALFDWFTVLVKENGTQSITEAMRRVEKKEFANLSFLDTGDNTTSLL